MKFTTLPVNTADYRSGGGGLPYKKEGDARR